MAVLNYADRIYLNGQEVDRVYLDGVQVYPPDYYQLFKDRVLADNGIFIENPIDFNNEKLLLTPNAYKEDVIYAALPIDGSGDFTFSRNSSATYIEDGIIKTAQANVPRIQDGKILIEGQATNIFIESEGSGEIECDWGLGFENMIILDNTSGSTVIYYRATVEAGKTYTMIFYGRRQDGEEITWNNSTTGANYDFGVWIAGPPVLISKTLVKDDIYKFVCQRQPVASSSNVGFYKGSGHKYSVIEISGIIIIEGEFTESSYIPTSGAAATRLADIATTAPPAGVTEIIETIDGVEQSPITVIPPTYQLPEGNIDNVKMI